MNSQKQKKVSYDDIHILLDKQHSEIQFLYEMIIEIINKLYVMITLLHWW